MKHLFLSSFLVAAMAISGCVTAPTTEAPSYSSAVPSGAKRVVLVVQKELPRYSLAQTQFVLGGAVGAAVGGPVDPVGTVKRESFDRAVNAVPGSENLYARFYSQLATKIRTSGVEVVEVERDSWQLPGIADAAQTSGVQWAYYIDSLAIMYYAKTLMNSYQPQASFSVNAYNAKTDTLYAAMFAVAQPSDASYGFSTADAAVNDPTKAYAGLAKAASEAADVAYKLILNGKVAR